MIPRIGRQPARLAMVIIGMLVTVAAVAATVHRFQDRVGIYDEGILLTDSYLITTGAFPFRDFYSVYPPGVFLLIVATWKVLGVSISATRLLGLAIHLSIAIAAGHLAGRAAGRSFSWFGAGVVLLWISPLGLPPYAWLAALAVALLAMCVAVTWSDRWYVVAPAPRAWRPAAFCTGALLGAVSAFRHDLFVYLTAVLAAVLLIVAIWNPSSRKALIANTLPVVAGAAAVTVVFWVPSFVLGGVERTLGDLYFDLSKYVMPAREHSLTLDGPTPIRVVMAALLFCLAAPLMAGGLVLLARGQPRELVASLLLGVLAIAVLPQMVRRFDGWHILYSVTPGLALFAVLAERLASNSRLPRALVGVVAAGLILFLAWPLIPGPSALRGLRLPTFGSRESGMPAYQYEWRRDVLRFIEQQSLPGEPIFVGNNQHRKVTFNDLTLHYLAERPGATRYLQFDPGQVTREEVQREMIAQLETSRPKVAVLFEGGYSPEPNPGIVEGSSLLDEYLAAHYQVVDSSGVYLMLLRKPWLR